MNLQPNNTFFNAQPKMSEKTFVHIRDLIFRHAGISMGDSKRALVLTRLTKVLRDKQLSSFEEYIDELEHNPNEMIWFINALTTNKTSFFRDSSQFDFFKNCLEEITAKKALGDLRIWSAASSTGQETYTIGIVAKEVLRTKPGWKVKILGSDIDTEVIRTASVGEYSSEELIDVPVALREKYFIKRKDGGGKVSQIIQQDVRFRRINLVYDDFRFKEPVDIIFCRNVFIYFDNDTRKKVVDKFRKVLAPKGYLFLGHSESLLGDYKDLKPARANTYQHMGTGR